MLYASASASASSHSQPGADTKDANDEWDFESVRVEPADVRAVIDSGTGKARTTSRARVGRSVTAPTSPSPGSEFSANALPPSASTQAPALEPPTSPLRRAHTTPHAHAQLLTLARLEALRATRAQKAQSTVNTVLDGGISRTKGGRRTRGEGHRQHQGTGASEDEVDDALQTQELAEAQAYLHDIQGLLNGEIERRLGLRPRTRTRAGRADTG